MKETDLELISRWKDKKSEIEKRLEEFASIDLDDEKKVFQEMCFCLLTPQSSALRADRAIRHLARTCLLLDGTEGQIANILNGCGILYANNKASYILEARLNLFSHPKIKYSQLLVSDPYQARERVIQNIKGLGYKEASHFLRNIGYRGLAILDRHVLRTLCQAEVIECVPTSLSRSRYLKIEKLFLSYAERLGIPPDGLDLLMWSAKTGMVFK